MKEELTKIEEIIVNPNEIKISNIQELMEMFFAKLKNRVDNYIGDYPTFIEPVYLEDNVKIGDDVLLGPNVYIGANSKIEDYVELSNTIIFDNVKVGENFKLENCIVAKNSSFNFKNLNLRNNILKGSADSKSELQNIGF
jgi:NDP-sugar pyrophosphorylase family protein